MSAARAAYDLSSHQVAIHAAAPCPVDVKRRMIEWWGPIIHEYYAGTEGTGATIIDSADWMAHPGSVGQAALGVLHICDEEGTELPTGEAGLIYFEREQRTFAYHNDAAKTRAALHPAHENWMSLGDVGYVDDEGYLYLTDRKAFMIISGGVNIYPQAIEDALILHPKVADVAVFGVPNEEMGEEVNAVLEPAAGRRAWRGSRRRAAGLRPRAPGPLHGPALGGLHRGDAAPADRQALQTSLEGQILEWSGDLRCRTGLALEAVMTPASVIAWTGILWQQRCLTRSGAG